MTTHEPRQAAAHAASRNAADMFGAMWNTETNVDPASVERMTNMELEGGAMSVDELNGGVEPWSDDEMEPPPAAAAAAPAPSAPSAPSAKKMGKQPVRMDADNYDDLFPASPARQKPKQKHPAPARARGKQASNARPRVVDDGDALYSSDEDGARLDASPFAPHAGEALLVSSDDEEDRPLNNRKPGDVAFSGAVPARPTIDMTPKTTHAANLKAQMRPLGTGRFGKQTRDERLTAGLRGDDATVRGVLGTTEPHPRGPRFERILALHQANEIPGVAALHATKTALAKYEIRHEELIVCPDEKRAERKRTREAMSRASVLYKRALEERVLQAQKQHDKWHKPPAAAAAAASFAAASSSTDPR